MHALTDRSRELVAEIIRQRDCAELALNRAGFKFTGTEWTPPERPSWAAAVEMVKTLARAEQMIEELTVERDALRDQVAQLQGEPA